MAMKLIKTEEITIKGVVYIVETYSDGERESVVKYPKTEPVDPEPIEPEPSQLDRIEEQVNAIANGTTSENTDAINALLGI